MLIIVDAIAYLPFALGLTLDGHVLKHNGRTLKDKEPVESLAGKQQTNSEKTI